jgi:hypothetical protein
MQLFFGVQVSAGDTADTRTTTFYPSGFVSSVFGKFIHYKFQGKDYSFLGINNSFVNLNLHLTPHKSMTIHLGLEGMMWYNQFSYTATMLPTERMGPFFDAYLDRAEGEILLCDNGALKLDLGIGYFPYKYNPDAQNLGEYLFRTGTYPGWIVTTVDWAIARISGIRHSSTAFGIWKNDLLLTRESSMWPFNDLSLTDISSVSFANVLDIGAGIQFARFISANGDLTTPKTIGNISSISANGRDTVYYTFSGVKPMVRAAFNLKGIFPLLGMNDPFSFCGREDLKIYGEAAILGLANQGDSAHLRLYDTLSQRIPIMFGMNWFTHPLLSYPVILPCAAFGITNRDITIHDRGLDSTTGMEVFDTTYGNKRKITNAVIFGAIGVASGAATWLLNRYFNINGALDLISVELEHYGSPYPNGYLRCTNVQQRALPQPDDPNVFNYSAAEYSTQDNWKWSLYFSKTIMGHFRCIGQIARDHTRLASANLNNTDYVEAMVKRSHWYWAGKLAYNF